MHGTLCYDATCPFCLVWVQRLLPWLRRWGIRPRAIQAQDIGSRLGLEPGRTGDECKFISADGRVSGGGDVVAEFAEAAGWRWLAALLRWRYPRFILRWGYRVIEHRWHCQEGVCRRRERWWKPHRLLELLLAGQGERRRHGWW